MGGILKGAFGALIRKLDRVLRALYKIEDICEDDRCLFRLAFRRSPEEIRLGDGTHVKRADPVGEIHFLNEHFLPFVPHDSPVGWAKRTMDRGRFSLRVLASHIQDQGGCQPAVKALFGEWPMDKSDAHKAERHLFSRLGFEVRWLPEPRGPLEKVGRLFKDLYTFWLIRAFQPGGAPLLHALRHWDRARFWISRDELLRRYLRGANCERKNESHLLDHHSG